MTTENIKREIKTKGENNSSLQDVEIQWSQKPKQPKSLSKKIVVYFQSPSVHVAVLTLVIIDLVILTYLILLDQKVLRDLPTSQNVSSLNSTPSRAAVAQQVLDVLQLLLLVTFAAEMFVRLFAFGPSVKNDKWQMFDCGIVFGIFLLYIILFSTLLNKKTVTYCIGLFIFLRLWRFKRLYQAIVEPIKRHAQVCLATHRKEWLQAKDEERIAYDKLHYMQQEVHLLRNKLSVLQHQSGSMGMYESHLRNQPGTSEVESTVKPSFCPKHSSTNPSEGLTCRVDSDDDIRDRCIGQFPDVVEHTPEAERKEMKLKLAKAISQESLTCYCDDAELGQGQLDLNDLAQAIESHNILSDKDLQKDITEQITGGKGLVTEKLSSNSSNITAKPLYNESAIDCPEEDVNLHFPERNSNSGGQDPTKQFAFSNLGYNEDDTTGDKEKDETEIDLDDSTTYINGIPMTDL